MNSNKTLVYFETYELESYCEDDLHGASEDLMKNFRNQVKTHINYCETEAPGIGKFSLVLAKMSSTSIVGYHFFTEGVENIGCYLAAIYVNPEHRNQGIAYKLICKAVEKSHQRIARAFTIFFINGQALETSLVKKLLQFAIGYKDSSFYFSQPGRRIKVEFGEIKKT